MFSKLRRISTTLSHKSNSSSSRDSGYGSNSSSAANSPTGSKPDYFAPAPASLLGLPVELRQQIFVYVAQSTTLSVSHTRKPPSKKSYGPEPHGLLLANRQTRREFQYLLLSLASIEARIQNYDFTNLTRVLDCQSDAQRFALTRNANFWILLSASHVPTRDHALALRKWHDFRVAQLHSGRSTPAATRAGSFAAGMIVEEEEEDEDPIAPLPGDVYPSQPQFNYLVRFTSQIRPPRPAIRYASRAAMEADVLRSQIKMVDRVKGEAAGETDKAKDKRVIKCFDGELHRVANDLNRQLRSLDNVAKEWEISGGRR